MMSGGPFQPLQFCDHLIRINRATDGFCQQKTCSLFLKCFLQPKPIWAAKQQLFLGSSGRQEESWKEGAGEESSANPVTGSGLRRQNFAFPHVGHSFLGLSSGITAELWLRVVSRMGWWVHRKDFGATKDFGGNGWCSPRFASHLLEEASRCA